MRVTRDVHVRKSVTRVGRGRTSLRRHVDGLNTMGPGKRRRCRLRLHHHTFCRARVRSLGGTGDKLRAIVRSVSGAVSRQFTSTFGVVGIRFTHVVRVVFSNNGTHLRLASRTRPLRNNMRVCLRLPKGGHRPLALVSNNRQTLAIVTLLVSFVTCHPTPFYFISRVSTTLSSTGIRECDHVVTSCGEGARFIVVSREGGAVRFTSALRKIAVTRGNISSLIAIHIKSCVGRRRSKIS